MAEQNAPPNGHDPTTTLTVSEALTVMTAAMHRMHLRQGLMFDGARDMYAVLGYPHELTYQDYYGKYKRGGIAKPVIDAFVDDTWQAPPTLREVGKADERTPSPFETIWEETVKRLKLWRVIRRLDRQARLGRYAVLVLGLRGQTDWSAPATPVRDAADLLYVQAFSEEHSEILELVTEADSPLFLTPRLYDIDFSRRQGQFAVRSGLGRPAVPGPYSQRVVVHASRVLHVAESGLEDDLMGTPGLEAVWNYLLDLDKEVGGTAEMVWKDAKRRLVAELAEGAVLSPEDEERFSERIQQFMHQMLDVLQVQNIKVQQLEGKVPDASQSIDKKVELICGTIRMPKRRLLGTERGELASSEDEGNWLVNTIGGRQQSHGEEMVLNQLVDRWIDLRILPVPREGYEWDWPPLLTQTGQEKADEALAWTRSLAAFAGPGASAQDVLPTEIYLTDVLGWDPEQVERIMDILGAQEAALLRDRLAQGPRQAPQDEADDENDLTQDAM